MIQRRTRDHIGRSIIDITAADAYFGKLYTRIHDELGRVLDLYDRTPNVRSTVTLNVEFSNHRSGTVHVCFTTAPEPKSTSCSVRRVLYVPTASSAA